jgi:hypothetical protein
MNLQDFYGDRFIFVIPYLFHVIRYRQAFGLALYYMMMSGYVLRANIN